MSNNNNKWRLYNKQKSVPGYLKDATRFLAQTPSQSNILSFQCLAGACAMQDLVILFVCLLFFRLFLSRICMYSDQTRQDICSRSLTSLLNTSRKLASCRLGGRSTARAPRRHGRRRVCALGLDAITEKKAIKNSLSVSSQR